MTRGNDSCLLLPAFHVSWFSTIALCNVWPNSLLVKLPFYSTGGEYAVVLVCLSIRMSVCVVSVCNQRSYHSHTLFLVGDILTSESDL